MQIPFSPSSSWANNTPTLLSPPPSHYCEEEERENRIGFSTLCQGRGITNGTFPNSPFSFSYPMSANPRCTTVEGENGAAATPIHLILPPPPTHWLFACMDGLSLPPEEMGQGRWFEEEGFPLPYPILVPILTSLRIGEDGGRRGRGDLLLDDLSLFLFYLIQLLFGGGKLTVARVFASPIRGESVARFLLSPRSFTRLFTALFFLGGRNHKSLTNCVCEGRAVAVVASNPRSLTPLSSPLVAWRQLLEIQNFFPVAPVSFICGKAGEFHPFPGE